MRLLLDTHILLWWAEGSPKLGEQAQQLLSATHDELVASAASWWEMSIKKALGRLNVDFPLLRSALTTRKVRLLDVSFAHAEVVVLLPPLHGDPFDRMLVAQAQVEGLRLLTRDARLKAYGQAVLCT